MSLRKFLDLLRAKGVPAQQIADVFEQYKNDERKMRQDLLRGFILGAP